MSDLLEHFNKSQPYLKLGDDETFNGIYVSWEAIQISYKGNVKKGYRFVLERTDGSRLNWDTANGKVITDIGILIKKHGLKKGDPIKIHRQGIEKENTKYTITAETPF